MAEVWYLEVETRDLSEKEPRYRIDFQECIALFELSPGRWRCAHEEIPRLKTGNPLIDDSGCVYVYIRVKQDEIENVGLGEVWKTGWYLSSLTLIGAENKLRKQK
jgi:hypothetical protein